MDLELPQTPAVHSELACDFLELPAVVYSEHTQLLRLPAGRSPVQMHKPLVVPEPVRSLGHDQEVLKLFRGRHGRGAAVAGDYDSAAGVSEAQTLLQWLLAQPAGEEATHKGVARAYRVEDLYWEARNLYPLFEVVRDLPWEDYGPHRADLEYDGRLAQIPDAFECLAGVDGATGYPDLLLSPNHEVALGQHRPVAFSDLFAGDEHLAALLVGGNAPEHRPVVQIEDDAGPCLLGCLYRLEGGRAAPWSAEGRARYEQSLRGGDEVRVYVIFA